MRTPTSLDRATDQLVDGAVETVDVVADALVDAAHNAVDVAADVLGDGSEALAALTVGGVARRIRQPRVVLALLVTVVVGAWLYRRFSEGGDPVDDELR